ncbi:DUF998 domain-containing protein [Haloarculaceae archaeon H-GB2-1]|nr:DUF998 domain-containing protein [Haloarculaceae archaeon H-GB1-1]MEA5409902.1 DUF998 domain-containing protein [Haloarculaceae archaeon H-GB2-1]
MTGETGQSVPTPLRNPSTIRLVSLVGIAGSVVFWVIVVALGVLTPGYSFVSDYISTLAAVDAPYAIIQRANFFVFGWSIIVLAFGLAHSTRDGWRLMTGIVLIGIFGAGIFGAGVFQDNLANPSSTTAQVHQLVSIVAFVAALIGMPLTSWGFERSEWWPEYRYPFTSFRLAIVLLASLVVFRIGLDTWWAGLAQRQFLLLLTGWIVFHAVTLYRLTRLSHD